MPEHADCETSHSDPVIDRGLAATEIGHLADTCAGFTGSKKGTTMIILGVILAVLGLIFSISILWTIGIVLIVVGVVLWLLGATGHAVAGRRHYY